MSYSYSNKERYEKISEICKGYDRSFSVLDLGAAEGYFTNRLADDFEGSFIAVESDKRRGLANKFKSEGKENVFLLEKKLTLEDLINISEVNYFDVILALNVIHHFDEPFQDVLDVLMSMCSYCVLEHPHMKEDNKTINFQRIEPEPLNLDFYNPKFLIETKRWKGVVRKMYLLEDTKEKVIKRRWSGGTYYKEGEGIVISPSFRDISIRYLHRDENRPWIVGLNLRTYIEYEGSYPTPKMVSKMIDDIKITGSKIDLAPHNLIFGSSSNLILIDQNDAQWITEIQELKSHLRQKLSYPI